MPADPTPLPPPASFASRHQGSIWRSPWMLLGLVWLFVAGPFLTTRQLGTGEAYNYSLALADFVTQVRAGEWPPLVGQSEYAFNGRIHPLRTAPALLHVAGLLDVVTFRLLSFWALQNAVLALSLLGTIFTTYRGLRWATTATPKLALFLSAALALSPALLSLVYAMDLYMSLVAAPWVVVAIAANVRAYRNLRFRTLAVLAIAHAGAWLSHPPIALWLTLGTALLQLPLVLTGRYRFRQLGALVAALGLGLALGGFAFASALSVQDYGAIARADDPGLLLNEVARVFPASLRPVSATASELGDFQLGYLLWGLLTLSLVGAVVRRAWPAVALLAVAALFLCLTTPVPGVNPWLWTRLPAAVVNLTNQWPMQRLYLPTAVLTVFAFACVWRAVDTGRWPKVVKDAGSLALAAIALWTGFQAWQFVGRGYASRQSSADSVRAHLPENVEPTLIGYALVGAPPSFTNGVMDPAFEFRLLARGDAHEVLTNWQAPATPVRRGVFEVVERNPGSLTLAPRLTLEPGKHYRLTLARRIGLPSMVLQITGGTLSREYPLPVAGGPRGFGLQAGNNPAISLRTSGTQPAEVELRLVGDALAGSRMKEFTPFTLESYDPAKLPIAVQSWVPLRLKVNAPEPGYLETCRMFIEGYAATVNGKPARVQSSLDRLVMLPVEAGENTVELRYEGPGWLRASFWLSLCSWAGLAAFGLAQQIPATRTRLSKATASAADQLSRRKLLVAGAAGAVILLGGAFVGVRAWWNRPRPEAGPLRIRLVLPRNETGRGQPLLTTGKPFAGTFVFIRYTDPTHIQIGIDVWGVVGALGDPVPVDYYGEQEIIVSTGALYPEGHPAVAALAPAVRTRLLGRITVTVNGKPAFEREVKDYPAAPEEIHVGVNPLGGSSAEPEFWGRILEVERLPVTAGPQ